MAYGLKAGSCHPLRSIMLLHIWYITLYMGHVNMSCLEAGYLDHIDLNFIESKNDDREWQC